MLSAASSNGALMLVFVDHEDHQIFEHERRGAHSKTHRLSMPGTSCDADSSDDSDDDKILDSQIMLCV
jgi:hypothetical protein